MTGVGKISSVSLAMVQRVTKRCRLSLLTNGALDIRVQMRWEGESCGFSANEYSCAHHVTWSPNKPWRSTSIFNLCCGGNKLHVRMIGKRGRKGEGGMINAGKNGPGSMCGLIRNEKEI
jgi:hypothetical protein